MRQASFFFGGKEGLLQDRHLRLVCATNQDKGPSCKTDARCLSPALNTRNKLQPFRAGPLGSIAKCSSPPLINAADLTRSRAAPPACRGSAPPPRRTEARAKRTLYPPPNKPSGCSASGRQAGSGGPQHGSFCPFAFEILNNNRICI